MTPQILVTGGAGFIGSAIVHGLNQEGREGIIVSDFLGTGDKFRNLVPLRFDDYLEADALLAAVQRDDGLLAGVETVFHLGACSSTTETDNRYLIQNNYEYTKTLAAWALKRGARFVYASSAATYGDGSAGMADDAPLQPLRPLNMYGYSKHLFDLHANRRGWLQRVCGLKYFNVFGPNEAHKGDMMSLVPRAYRQIHDTGRLQLFRSHHPDYADGGQLRDFLYVKDAVAATLHLARTPAANGLFNVGSGVATRWRDLGAAIFEALGKPVHIDYTDMPEHLRGKYQYKTCADISRLRAAGFQRPMTPIAGVSCFWVFRPRWTR